MKIKKNNNSNLELVNIVIAGSVDDGKSTLIGRLLYDCEAIYEDQLLSIKNESLKNGERKIDFSLLTDGLSAEREQKITIDVAYRYFNSTKRRFIIADVPGHEQYTRNMVTGASNADLAVILVDARKGLLRQSKRHLFIASLLGIPHLAVIVNKMDLVNYDKEVFYRIRNDFTNFAAKLKITDIKYIPISAKKGDMVVERGKKMPWYNCSTVFSYLENLVISPDRNLVDFRFPVQYVIRPHQDFRGYLGTIEGGVIKKGEQIRVLPANKKAKVKSIFYDRKEKSYAFNPQSVVLTLNKELDVSRGDMIVRVDNLPEVATEFEATISWFSEEPMVQNQSYLVKHTNKTTKALINKIRYRMNIDNLRQEESKTLKINEIGRVYIKTLSPLMFDPYSRNRHTGSFIIIDELTNNTVGAGIIIGPVSKFIKSNLIGKTKKDTLLFEKFSESGKNLIFETVYEYLKSKRIDSKKFNDKRWRQLENLLLKNLSDESLFTLESVIKMLVGQLLEDRK